MTIRFDAKKSNEPVQRDLAEEAKPTVADGKAQRAVPRAQESQSSLARKIPSGSGIGQFARQSAVARFDDVKRTLTAHPERADELIEQRLRGWNGTDRAIVRAAVGERGNTGFRRYADAEAALRELRAFGPDERGDILAIMKAGATFRQAVGDERRALVSTKSPPPATPAADLRNQAIANTRKEAKEVTELGRKVGALVRQIGGSARVAESVVGLGSASGLLGGAAWKTSKAALTRSTEPLKELLHGAGDAAEMMVGGVTGTAGRSGRIANATKTAQRFFEAGERHTDARTRFERATRDGDYGTMTDAKRQVGTAATEMRGLARQLEAEVKTIAKWDANLAKGAFGAGMQVAGTAGAELPDGMVGPIIDRAVEIAVDEAPNLANHGH
jgi:hypothetical protein